MIKSSKLRSSYLKIAILHLNFPLYQLYISAKFMWNNFYLVIF